MRHPPQIVFGLGSGRCGTQSLAGWLDRQEGARVFLAVHGPAIPWEGGCRAIDEVIRGFLSTPGARLIGDAAPYYLPYVEHILAAHPHVRFICLKRDREETVVSFLKTTLHKNFWIAHDGVRWKRTPWDRCFPKYQVSDKAEAIGRYWDDYYRRAAELAVEYPRAFRVFPTDALNTAEGQHAILGHLGIPAESRRLLVGLRLNVATRSGLLRVIGHVLKLVTRGFPRRKVVSFADAPPAPPRPTV